MWGGVRNHEGYMDLTAYAAIKNAEKEKKMKKENFYKGDIFMIDKQDASEGGEPAVIVSSDEINDSGNYVLLVYLTEENGPMRPTDARIIAGHVMRAKCDRIYRIHKSRIGEFMRIAGIKEMKEIDKALMVALGLKAEANDDDLTRAQVQRDLYKQLYDETLDKLLGGYGVKED